MELITLKCPIPDCTNVVVLELLERGESARFQAQGIRMVPGPKGFSNIDTVWVMCPDEHEFRVAFRSAHRAQFQTY